MLPVGTAKKSAGNSKRWISKVSTVSTFPEKGIFTKDAETIARHMSSKKVSPKGVGSGIRMVQYFINRGGKGLSTSRRSELKRAIKIMQERRSKLENRKKGAR